MRNRAVIENILPAVNAGDFSIKRTIGESIKIQADIFADGHDLVNARLFYKHAKSKSWKYSSFDFLVNDRWECEFKVDKIGTTHYYIEAWVDYALNWQYELGRKVADGQHVDVELLDGLQYINAIKAKLDSEKKLLDECAKEFQSKKSYEKAVELAQSKELELLFRKYPYQTFTTKSQTFSAWVDRERAGFSAWYEFFPRSSGDDKSVHGTFKDAETRLAYVADMGFDVIYFPPIHPIGEKHRKGKNNATKASGNDVGSPWAIGSSQGGHKAINPELGTLKEFQHFVKAAEKHGIEIAMDFAIQCAPDHPYVKEHPQWFRWRPDGTVQYSENPPKKYQDILPINFECEDWENLWNELLSIVYYWIDKGVKIFRVDNPHTKPYRFWNWLIDSVHQKHPEIIFLAEAFTRPKVMNRLAKVGFTQSYTYFTWRTNKTELAQYIKELNADPMRQFFRPNFWPNTPDILPYELQNSNEAAYLTRFFLAATLSSNYGMYGPVYENMVSQAVPGKEEYWNSEKYQLENHSWKIQNKLHQVIKLVNQLRNHHKAMQSTFNTELCSVDNEHILAYYKSNKESENHILCAVNMDSYYKQGGWVQVPIGRIGLTADQSYTVKDLITQASYEWKGEWNYVELNPHGLPFHCFHILK